MSTIDLSLLAKNYIFMCSTIWEQWKKFEFRHFDLENKDQRHRRSGNFDRLMPLVVLQMIAKMALLSKTVTDQFLKSDAFNVDLENEGTDDFIDVWRYNIPL